MSITPSNQFTNQLKEYVLEDSAENSRQPCQHCMDLKRENLVEKDYKFKPFAFNAYYVTTAKSIECPYCNLIINAMQAFDINPLIGIPWELGATLGLVLKGNDNGTKHKLEFYITPGTCRCKYTWRNPYSIALTTLPDRRKEIANPSKLYCLFQTCPLHLG
jgi:hypothetical protein